MSPYLDLLDVLYFICKSNIAFILVFIAQEKGDCYKLTAAVMSCGEFKFKQKPRDEQCEPDDLVVPGKVAQLLGVDMEILLRSFCKPKIKVGRFIPLDMNSIL